MKSFLTCASILALSFSAGAAEKNDNMIYTQPSAGRDVYLTCKGYQVKDRVLSKLEKDAYLEGTGEQIQFALIATDYSPNALKVFFDSWGFTPFGLIENHTMHNSWTLIHTGGRVSVEENKIDYSFVDTRPQNTLKPESKTGVFLYNCRETGKRPSWVEKELTAAKAFSGILE